MVEGASRPVAAWDTSGPSSISVGGVRLQTRCFGPAPGDAETIVLLHEGLGSIDQWRDFPRQLAEATGCGVFAYDRRGYGGSDPAPLPRPLDYMTREAVDVLPQVLDAIGFCSGYLVGHSDGASIAAIHGGTVGDRRVRGIVLIAPHFFTETPGLQSIAQAREAYDNGDLRTRLAKYHANVDNTFRGWNDAWLDPDFARWNIEDVIDGIGVPVLAIQGKVDQYGTELQIDALRGRLAGSFEAVMLDGCAHSPHVEKLDRTVAAVAGFIRSIGEELCGTGPDNQKEDGR